MGCQTGQNARTARQHTHRSYPSCEECFCVLGKRWGDARNYARAVLNAKDNEVSFNFYPHIAQWLAFSSSLFWSPPISSASQHFPSLFLPFFFSFISTYALCNFLFHSTGTLAPLIAKDWYVTYQQQLISPSQSPEEFSNRRTGKCKETDKSP